MEDSTITEHNADLTTSDENQNNKEIVKKEKEFENKSSTFDFTERSWRTDFVLIVEGTRLHVAKNILSLSSPVFDRMLLSDFKESSSDELELPGKTKENVVEFLRCIYPNTHAQITCDNALKILPLIEEYQVLHLKARCEHALLEYINSDTPVFELLTHLREAWMFSLTDLREKCVVIASEKRKEDLDEAKHESHLPAEAWNEILERVNERLRLRIVELEASNADLHVEMETLKFDDTVVHSLLVDTDMTEEFGLLKQYLTADMRVSKDLGLDTDRNWKTEQIVLIVSLKSKGAVAVKEVVMWGIRLKVSVAVTDTLCLRVEKNRKRGKIDCKFIIISFLVSRQPRGQNKTLKFQNDFNLWKQEFARDLINTNEINKAHHGFMHYGKIGLIMQIYMSEPNEE